MDGAGFHRIIIIPQPNRIETLFRIIIIIPLSLSLLVKKTLELDED
jgi:hypothetical protein